MTNEHFREIGEDLYGYGWQSRLARALGMDGSTIRRWVSGSIPVPPSAEAFLEMMRSRQAARGAYVAHRHAVHDTDPKGVRSEEPLVRMTRKLLFTGIDRPKPVPTVQWDEGSIVLSERDDMAGTDRDITVVRHPDTSHLEGYLEEMRRQGVQPAVAKGKHHHYTGLVRTTDEEPVVTYLLSTHSGRIRLHRSRISDGHVLENTVMDIPGSDIGEKP